MPECWVTSFLLRLRKKWETRRTERLCGQILISDQCAGPVCLAGEVRLYLGLRVKKANAAERGRVCVER